MRLFRLDNDVRGEFADHWAVLVLALVCAFFAFAVPAAAIPFAIKAVVTALGWSREEASLIASAKYATGAASSIFVGFLLDKLGVRPLLMVTSVLAAIALSMFLVIGDLPTYYLAGVLLGLATPGSIVALKVLISRVFSVGQGTAMGVLMLSTSLGIIVVPLVITGAIEQFGWRTAFAALSLGIWLIALPLLIVAFPRGSGRDFTADSARASNASASAGFLRNRQFWVIGTALLLGAMVDQAFLQHQPLIFSDLGLSDRMVGVAISVFGVLSLVVRPILGNYFDKHSNRGIAVAYLFLSFACILALLLTNPFVLMAFVLFRAVGTSTVLIDSALLAKHTFGPKNLGLLLGLFTAFINIGFALGPWLMGRLYDATGSYAVAEIAFAVAAVVAAGLVFTARPHHWLAQSGGPAAPRASEQAAP